MARRERGQPAAAAGVHLTACLRRWSAVRPRNSFPAPSVERAADRARCMPSCRRRSESSRSSAASTLRTSSGVSSVAMTRWSRARSAESRRSRVQSSVSSRTNAGFGEAYPRPPCSAGSSAMHRVSAGRRGPLSSVGRGWLSICPHSEGRRPAAHRSDPRFPLRPSPSPAPWDGPTESSRTGGKGRVGPFLPIPGGRVLGPGCCPACRRHRPQARRWASVYGQPGPFDADASLMPRAASNERAASRTTVNRAC